MREEQSDELKGRIGGVSSLRDDTSVRDVAAAGFDTISNVVNTSSLVTRFARRSQRALHSLNYRAQSSPRGASSGSGVVSRSTSRSVYWLRH